MKSAECFCQNCSFSIWCWVDIEYNILLSFLFILLFVKRIIYIAPSIKELNENKFGR